VTLAKQSMQTIATDAHAALTEALRIQDLAGAERLLGRIGLSGVSADLLLVHRALLAAAQGKDALALARAWRAVSVHGSEPELDALLARLLMRRGLPDLACQVLQRAVANDPEDAAIQRAFKNLLRVHDPDRAHCLEAAEAARLAPETQPPPRANAGRLASERVAERQTPVLPVASISVIIPVYSGRHETEACLEAVLSAKTIAKARIVVVDDATPDNALARYLCALDDNGCITLLRNRANLGFTASANRGLNACEGHDVVLLNADTLVPDFWLDRLRSAVHAAPDIGTATPLSNNGEIVSHPAPGRPAPMPDRAQLERLDRAAASLNHGLRVDLPTGVGFCLYIRAACLRETGVLDAETFGRGYGEETDFCLRAAKRGWRHVCAADLFVAHRGATSFGTEKAALVQRNMARLARRHPEYRPMIAAFKAADPLSTARERLARATLASLKGGATLVCGPPDWRSRLGVQPLRQAAGTSGNRLLWLSVATERAGVVARLESDSGGSLIDLRYPLPEAAPALRADLRRLACRDRIVAEGLPIPIQRALDPLGLPERTSFEPVPCHVHADGIRCAGSVAVLGGIARADASAWLLRLARQLTAAGGVMRFFLLEATPIDARFARTGVVEPLGGVPAFDRADLARGLACRVALVLGDFAPPGDLQVSIMPTAAAARAIAPRVAVVTSQSEPAGAGTGTLWLDPAEAPADTATRLTEFAA